MIPLFKVYMDWRAGDEVKKVLDSGYIGQGAKVDEFEAMLKSKFNNDYCVTLNSATSALHLFFHMFGEDQDEVLTSALSCTATNWPILLNRKRIKWVDVRDDCNIDYDDLERKLSPTTKFILLVHWGGNPINLDRIQEITDKCFEMYGFRPIVLQDCAHSIGSKFRGNYLSEYFNSAYSFQAIKHFTAGDGGCLFLRDLERYKSAKLLRWYGIDRENNRRDFRCENDIASIGYKFHMNDINATIGICNFTHIDEVVKNHHDNSVFYDEQLKDVSGIKIIDKSPDSYSSQWIHTIHVEKRDQFMKYMAENGIMTSRVHERNDKHSAVKEFQTALPVLDKVVNSMICIPNGWWITEEDRQHIVETIKKGW